MNLLLNYIKNNPLPTTIPNSNYNYDHFQLKKELENSTFCNNPLPMVLIDIVINYIFRDDKDNISLLVIEDNNSMFSSIANSIEKILNNTVQLTIMKTIQLHCTPDTYDELVYIIKQTLNLTGKHLFLKFCDHLELRLENYELLQQLSKKMIQVHTLEDRNLLSKLSLSSIEKQRYFYLKGNTDLYIRTPTGCREIFDVCLYWSLLELKKYILSEIYPNNNIGLKKMILVFAGRICYDDSSLVSIGCYNRSEFHLLIKKE
jgi:hypothetical protein